MRSEADFPYSWPWYWSSCQPLDKHHLVQPNSIMETGAFGSGKAGSSVDPLVYLRKPSVVFRIGALVSLT